MGVSLLWYVPLGVLVFITVWCGLLDKCTHGGE